MLKDNVDLKFDFIGTLKAISPLAEVADEQMAAWESLKKYYTKV